MVKHCGAASGWEVKVSKEIGDGQKENAIVMKSKPGLDLVGSSTTISTSRPICRQRSFGSVIAGRPHPHSGGFLFGFRISLFLFSNYLTKTGNLNYMSFQILLWVPPKFRKGPKRTRHQKRPLLLL